MTKKSVLNTLAVGLVLGGISIAGPRLAGGDGCSKECPISKKVNELLAGWKAADEEAQALTPEAREQLAVKMASISEKCPIGSRLGDTLCVVNDVLEVTLASSRENAKNCPLQAEGSAACAAGKELIAARMEVLEKLNQLSSYTARATACPEKAASKASCTVEAGANASSCCPIRLASRIGAMKASFAVACEEAKALTPEARGAMVANLSSITEKNRALTLVPASVEALAEGFEALDHIHGKMAEWAKANPDLLKDAPPSVHQSYMLEYALIDEAGSLLTSVVETMKAMHAPAAAKASYGGF